MKKKLSVLFGSITLFFVVLLSSTNALAVIDDKSYEDGEVITESYTLYEPEQVAGFDGNKDYKDGEIISESYTLYEPEQTNATITETDNEISPDGIFVTIDKTITKYYSNFSSIPTVYPYKEYYQGFWYEGNLHLKSVVASGSGYTATFSGKLTAWIP